MTMFVRKRFGWGISPGDWRGWLLTAAYVAVAGALIHFFGHVTGSIGIAIWTIAFVAFAFWAYVRKI